MGVNLRILPVNDSRAKIAQKGKKLLEVARTANSCSKRQKLLKSCRAQSGQAYSAVTSFR